MSDKPTTRDELLEALRELRESCLDAKQVELCIELAESLPQPEPLDAEALQSRLPSPSWDDTFGGADKRLTWQRRYLALARLAASRGCTLDEIVASARVEGANVGSVDEITTTVCKQRMVCWERDQKLAEIAKILEGYKLAPVTSAGLAYRKIVAFIAWLSRDEFSVQMDLMKDEARRAAMECERVEGAK